MKTNRALTSVLAVLVVLFAFLWLSGRKKAAEPGEMWRTNIVQVFQTNTVDSGPEKIVQVERTNTIVQTVTNVVVKEVPVRLSAQEQQAGVAGVKYLKAPSLAEGSTALYKASPVVVEMHVNTTATNIVTDRPADLKKTVEAALSSRDIPVTASGPYRLSLHVSGSWVTDMPMVAVLSFRLELLETVALQRQSDIIKCPAAVWSTTLVRMVRTVNTSEEVKKAVQDTVERFCDDFATAKDGQQKVESRLPTVPQVFVQ
jgi:hypothetical protein